jgi:hypothetical protein
MFHTYVASVLPGCCKCFYNGFSSVSNCFCKCSDACFKCFICLQTYVVNISFVCFKNRSDVASVLELYIVKKTNSDNN